MSVTVSLDPGESFVIAGHDFWTYMADVCEAHANDYKKGTDEYSGWIEARDLIKYQAIENLQSDPFYAEDEDYNADPW